MSNVQLVWIILYIMFWSLLLRGVLFLIDQCRLSRGVDFLWRNLCLVFLRKSPKSSRLQIPEASLCLFNYVSNGCENFWSQRHNQFKYTQPRLMFFSFQFCCSLFRSWFRRDRSQNTLQQEPDDTVEREAAVKSACNKKKKKKKKETDKPFVFGAVQFCCVLFWNSLYPNNMISSAASPSLCGSFCHRLIICSGWPRFVLSTFLLLKLIPKWKGITTLKLWG